MAIKMFRCRGAPLSMAEVLGILSRQSGAMHVSLNIYARKMESRAGIAPAFAALQAAA
jgi:hypothetical protein